MHCSFSELEVISPLSIPEIMPQIQDLIQGKLTAMNPKSGLLCYHDSVLFKNPVFWGLQQFPSPEVHSV